jgi:hypothetical protein
VADAQSGMPRAVLRQLVSLLIQRLQQVTFGVLCFASVAGLHPRADAHYTDASCLLGTSHRSHWLPCNSTNFRLVHAFGYDCRPRSTQTPAVISPCRTSWRAPSSAPLAAARCWGSACRAQRRCHLRRRLRCGPRCCSCARSPSWRRPAAATPPPRSVRRAVLSAHGVLRSRHSLRWALSPAKQRCQGKPGAWSSAHFGDVWCQAFLAQFTGLEAT